MRAGFGFPRVAVQRFRADLVVLPTWARVLGVALTASALLTTYPRGGLGASAVVLASIALCVVLAELLAVPEDRHWLVLGTVVAIGARETLVGVIDLALLSRGLVTYAPDERIYAEHAVTLLRHWIDPTFPADEAADSVLSLWYVHWMARLYVVFGENLVVVKVLNALMAVIVGLFGYRTMRNLGMSGARWAFLLLLTFPSIAFWASLGLKDSYVIFFLVASLWTASEFVRARNPLWLVLSFLVLFPLESVRRYMFVEGALALLAVPFALKGARERAIKAIGIASAVYVVFGLTQPFRDLGANPLYIPIFVRSESAAGARSSFVQPRPVIQGEPGQRFQIAIEGAQPPTTSSPRIIVVEPGTAIVVERPGAPPPTSAPTGGPPVAVVQPGDIVIIATARPSPAAVPTPTPPARTAQGSATPAPPTPTPTPTPQPTPTPTLSVVVLEPDAKNVVGLAGQVDPDQTSFQGSLATNIRHLPTGILFTLFAPFPWAATTLEQFATIPEMLLWYASLALALLGFIRLFRRRDFRYAQGVASIIGLVILLSLISANVGTLVRSRAMLIVFVLLLTAVGVDLALARWSWLARWRRFADESHSRS
jgi:hypothetical protein